MRRQTFNRLFKKETVECFYGKFTKLEQKCVLLTSFPSFPSCPGEPGSPATPFKKIIKT